MNKYIETGWLLLISPDKVRKEKDELRDSNSQFKYCMNDPKASVSAPKRDPSLLQPDLRLLKTKPRISSCKWLD